MALPLFAALVASGLFMSGGSSAAPQVSKAKPKKIEAVGSRPTATATKDSGIRVVGVRARKATDGSPWPYQPGTAPAYEVDITNPMSTARDIHIEQDNVGSYGVNVPANSTTTFLIARPYGFLPCVLQQSWYVWVRENPDAKRAVKMIPSCTFSIPPPVSNPREVAQLATLPGKVTYSGARVKAAPSRCEEPFLVEADLHNKTANSINASLLLLGYPPTNVTLAPGETKHAVSTGVATFTGGDGRPAQLRLADNANPNNPAVVGGSFSVNLVASCQATFLLQP